MSVLALGDLNIDITLRLPKSGHTRLNPPTLLGGGTVGNTAAGLARLGVPTRFVGKVGDDYFGRHVAQEMKQEGVDTSLVVFDKDSPTQAVISVIRENGERCNYVCPTGTGANNRLRKEELGPAVFDNIRWMHTSGMVLREEPTASAIIYAMEQAGNMGITVSLDLNLRIEFFGFSDAFCQLVLKAVDLADIVFGSAGEEIVPLTKAPDWRAGAKILSDGGKKVIARKGAVGASAFFKGKEVLSPGFTTEVADTLGAGDAFNSGFIAACIFDNDLKTALEWGNGAAGYSVEKQGARTVPNKKALMAFIANRAG